MNLEINTVYYGFKLIEETMIKELHSTARVFQHEKSGARLIYLSNEDAHKVFTMTFKTLPEDDKGTAHIIEHAVCCSSVKYPLKDTFIALEKGSLCTTLNACTYQDMTMYYCASQNNKDFMHLMEVYMDLVFNPLVLTEPCFFEQEGWHYKLQNEKEAIGYSGVVYHEMLGEYDDASTVLERVINQSLFSETIYRFDSGGLPECIPNLTYKECLAFYERYYQTSNTCFYLYGNGDVLKHLAFIDRNYLKQCTKKEVKAKITLQPSFDKPKQVHHKYAVDSDTKTKDKALLAISFVVGTAENAKLRLTFEILEQLLLKSSSSPLVEELIVRKQLGKCLGEGGYNACKRQPVFSIILKETNKNKMHCFEQSVFNILKEFSEKGIDKKRLNAAINTVAFKLKEADYDGEPKGLIYSELIQNSLLYGGAPFCHLYYEELLKQIEQEAEKGYFEEIIKGYLIENNHRTSIILEPSKQLKRQKENAQRKALKVYKKSLSKEQVKQLIEAGKKREEMQIAPLTKEALQKLPRLKIEDLRKKAESFCVTESSYDGVKILFNQDAAEDIVYIHLLFDVTTIKEEDIPYVGLLASLVTYLDTAQYNHLEIDSEINQHLGGLNCVVNAYPDYQKSTEYKPLFKISAKLFIDKMPVYIDLLREIILNTKFTNAPKIKEIIGQIKYEMEQGFENASEYFAVQRIYTAISHAGAYEDYISGVNYYYFIKTLYVHFDERFKDISIKLSEVFANIMVKSQLTVFFTADKNQKESVEHYVKLLIRSLNEKKIDKQIYHFKPDSQNEAFIISGSLQSIAIGLQYKHLDWQYDGVLQVISHLLESTYLWDKIRLQGGAYGCQVEISSEGNLVVYSYLDPELLRTVNIFRGIGIFLKNLQLEQEELERYIIGTIGLMDIPLSMEQRSERTLSAYLSGVKNSQLQKTRDEILTVTIEEIHRYAGLFDEISRQSSVCVIGSAAAIKENSQLFKVICRLSD